MNERGRAGARFRKMSGRFDLSQCGSRTAHSILTVVGAISSFPRTFF